MSVFAQGAHGVRLEWGPAAIEQAGRDVDCVIVVDVMSFSTCVDIACGRGATVLPYAWRDDGALAYAQGIGAVLASRERGVGGGFSLSPASLASVPAGLKLVLPSPNGSAISFAARALGAAVFCGSLRNRTATAAACRGFERILVVACGERWPDGSLRPALEDWIGAGAIVAALGRDDLSPEARAAVAAHEAMGTGVLATCGSALELVERGFAPDVAACLDEDASPRACILRGAGYATA